MNTCQRGTEGARARLRAALMGTDRDLAARKQDSPLCTQELQEEAGATTPGMGRLTWAGSWQLWV